LKSSQTVVHIRRQFFQLFNGEARKVFRKFLKFFIVESWVDRLSKALCESSIRWRSIKQPRAIRKILCELDLPILDFQLESQFDAGLNGLITQGKDFREMGKFLNERNLYEQAVNLHPERIEPRLSLAAVEFLEGNLDAWTNQYQSISQISLKETLRRFKKEPSVRLLGVEWTGPMGHLAQIDAIVKLGKLGKLGDERRVVVTNFSQIANSTVLELWKNHIAVFQLSTFNYNRFKTNYWSIFEHVPFIKIEDRYIDQTTAWNESNVEWEKIGLPPLLGVPEKINHLGKKVLSKWGLRESDWFATLHVREGNHVSRRQLPNADVEAYIPAIKKIISIGGKVIRMGNPRMKPLPKIPGLVDYAHSAQRSDWMDVFLWGNSKFFIGTNSGGSDIPIAFGIPMIKTNFCHVGQSFYSPNSFMVPKLFQDVHSGEILRFEQVFNSPFAWTVSDSHSGFEYKHVDNSPEILVAAVEEMISNLNGSPDEKLIRSTQSLVSSFDHLRKKYRARGSLPISRRFLDHYRELF